MDLTVCCLWLHFFRVAKCLGRLAILLQILEALNKGISNRPILSSVMMVLVLNTNFLYLDKLLYLVKVCEPPGSEVLELVNDLTKLSFLYKTVDELSLIHI